MSTATTFLPITRDIDVRSVVTLVVFLVVNILVIFPLYIPIPDKFTQRCRKVLGLDRRRGAEDQSVEQVEYQERSRKWSIPLNLSTVPVIGVLLLLASTCIPSNVLKDGIVGQNSLKPYDILTLFISFAYISLSLDSTGLLQYLAFKVASKSGKSGKKLYTSFYLFYIISGTIVGNDPIILSGTPFLIYFTRHTGITQPTAYLFTEFQLSNLVSAILVSSNPTNLVLTSAFELSFLRYTAWLVLPVLTGCLVLYPLLRFVIFRDDEMIPEVLEISEVRDKGVLVDPVGAVFGAVVFGVTILVLVGLSAGGILEGVEGVWTVTAPAAFCVFVGDCVHDLRRDEFGGMEENEKGKIGNDIPSLEGGIAEHIVEVDNPSRSETMVRTATSSTTVLESNTDVHNLNPTIPKIPDEESPNPSPTSRHKFDKPQTSSTIKSPTPARDLPTSTILQETKARPHNSISKLTNTFPTVSQIIKRLPLSLIPFAFSMFILVEALNYTGWIKVFAIWWKAWEDVSGVGGCIWLMGVIGVLGCNIFGTNIGATILLSRVLQQWQATSQSVSQRSLYGSIFALAIASNYGAYSFVFSASLAGLLWRNILKQKDLVVSPMEFIKWNTIPVIVTMVVSCLVVAGEVCIIYHT